MSYAGHVGVGQAWDEVRQAQMRNADFGVRNGRKRLTNRDERDKRDDFLCALYGEENLSRNRRKAAKGSKRARDPVATARGTDRNRGRVKPLVTCGLGTRLPYDFCGMSVPSGKNSSDAEFRQ